MGKVKGKGRGLGRMIEVRTFDTDTIWAARWHEQSGGACPRGVDGLPVRLVDVGFSGHLGTI